MNTTIPPSTIFNWVEQAPTDDSAWQNLDDLLEHQPESPEHCLAVCYLIRVGIQDAMEADDGDEIMAIWEWAEKALGCHSQIRQLWACDLVGEYLATQPQPPVPEPTLAEKLEAMPPDEFFKAMQADPKGILTRLAQADQEG